MTTPLFSSTGPLDKANVAFALAFTTTWVLGVVLAIPAAQDFLRGFYSVFGIFSTGAVALTFDKGHVAVGSGAYILPLFGMYLPMVMGTEGAAHRHSRHVYGFWVWLGWVLYHLKYLVVDTNDAYSGSPSNYFWLINNTLMVYCHYVWVGNDIFATTKQT